MNYKFFWILTLTQEETRVVILKISKTLNKIWLLITVFHSLAVAITVSHKQPMVNFCSKISKKN
jgi:hypothetical protein